MQIRMRDVHLDKPSVSESKTSWFFGLHFFRDEANFHLGGPVNKQNMCFWPQAQPHEHQYRPLGAEKVTVWCASGRNDIIGPYWFKHADRRPVTVNTKRYIEVMRRKFMRALKWKRGVDVDAVIIQRDRATSYCFNASLEYFPLLLPWRQAHLSSWGPPLICTFSRPIPISGFIIRLLSHKPWKIAAHIFWCFAFIAVTTELSPKINQIWRNIWSH